MFDVSEFTFYFFYDSFFSSPAFFKGTNIENPECRRIYAAQAGDTCESIIELFNLTDQDFNSNNPNLNCDKIFVGEWLCTNGTLSS